jgi:hypothetical protein
MLHLLPSCYCSFHHHNGVLSEYHEASPLHLYNSVCVMCEHLLNTPPTYNFSICLSFNVRFQALH